MTKPNAESTNSPIRDKFLADRENMMTQTQGYLNDASNNSRPDVSSPEALSASRKNVVELVKGGDFSKALEGLEEMRDARSGISTTKIEGKDGATPVVIRDARNCKTPAERSTESFEGQCLNAYRAAIEVAGLEGNQALQDSLKQEAVDFITTFHDENSGKSQEELSKAAKKVTKGIVAKMDNSGIEKAGSKLNTAKEFQNFNDTHCNVATLSAVTDKAGKTHTVVEAEVALKGLTSDQKGEFDKAGTEQKPEWYKGASGLEQKLIEKYTPAITDGTHVIPTQLRGSIPGMRNAFEKVTAVMESGGNALEELHSSKHAGTLASLVKDKDSRQDLTNQNARQAQEWMGTDVKVHCNTLNSRRPGGDDIEIIESTTKAMESVGGKETNTAFNGWRTFGFASDVTGAKELLSEIAGSLDNIAGDKDQAKALKVIQSHIDPKSSPPLFGPSFEDALAKLPDSLLTEKDKEVLRDSAGMAKNVKAADANIRFGDSENVSLTVSTEMNQLTTKIRNNAADSKLQTLPKEDVLTMCASGKDRTGLAEHDQTAQAVAARFGMDIKDVDKQILVAGHTAEQAGSIRAGGGTIGCHGTKEENLAGLPASRRENLEAIVEVSSANNKIKNIEKGYFKKPKENDFSRDEDVEQEAETAKGSKSSKEAEPSFFSKLLKMIKNLILGKQGKDPEATEAVVLDGLDNDRAKKAIETPEKQKEVSKENTTDLDKATHSAAMSDVLKQLKSSGVKGSNENSSNNAHAPTTAKSVDNTQEKEGEGR